MALVGAIFFGLSWNRLQVFSDPVALWNESVQRLDGRDDLPFVFRMYHNRGVAYANREGNANLALAIADYSRALALNPAHAEVFSDRGVAHFYLGNYAQARLDFNSALELKPRYPMAQRGRGLSLLKLGYREKGLADLAATCVEHQFGCDVYRAELTRPALAN
jgi:lipoprotein NlpI